MHHELKSLADPDAVARAGAAFVAERARAAVAASGSFHFAVSGGHTPWAMFAELASHAVPWDAVVIYQVDQRVAPSDDPDRQILWLVTGADKREPLAKLLAGDTTIPAGRVETAASLVMADHAAA
jgi:6-phosphogluconolactonase/glucosamine-6-phosphate isomerase/deaminase